MWGGFYSTFNPENLLVKGRSLSSMAQHSVVTNPQWIPFLMLLPLQVGASTEERFNPKEATREPALLKDPRILGKQLEPWLEAAHRGVEDPTSKPSAMREGSTSYSHLKLLSYKGAIKQVH